MNSQKADFDRDMALLTENQELFYKLEKEYENYSNELVKLEEQHLLLQIQRNELLKKVNLEEEMRKIQVEELKQVVSDNSRINQTIGEFYQNWDLMKQFGKSSKLTN